MNLYIGADHAGFHLKEEIKKYFQENNIKFEDLGAHDYQPDDDYPIYGKKVAEAVSKDEGALGILICGTSFGICIAANKFRGIRAVSVSNVSDARLSREHNNANILCLAGGEMTKGESSYSLSKEESIKIINTWINSNFSNAERHIRRLNQIKDIENKQTS